MNYLHCFPVSNPGSAGPGPPSQLSTPVLILKVLQVFAINNAAAAIGASAARACVSVRQSNAVQYLMMGKTEMFN